MATALAACAPHAGQSDQSDRAGTTAVHAPAAGDISHLSAVRLTAAAGSGRLEFEFTDRVPGYTIGYEPLPAHADASGAEIPLPGATAMVQITLTPATAGGWGGGQRTYFGPADLPAADGPVTAVKAAGDFEAVLTWVAGLHTEVPFRVLVLDGPPRLVVEFQP